MPGPMLHPILTHGSPHARPMGHPILTRGSSHPCRSAREAYRRSLQLNQRNAATFHAWGVLEWRCGNTELATQLFRKGLEASPTNRYILQSWACMEAYAPNE